MPAPNKVTRYPKEVRSEIDRLLRGNQHSLEDVCALVREQFPEIDPPSKSGLHRYKKQFDAMTKKMREIEAASQALVGELGEAVGEKSGQLLAQAVTTLVTDMALRSHGDSEELSVGQLKELTLAAKHAADTRRITHAEREKIEQHAREKLLREQKEKLDELEKSGVISPEQLALVMKAGYDL